MRSRGLRRPPRINFEWRRPLSYPCGVLMGQSVKAISSFGQDVSSVQRLETSLPGVIELRPKVFRDARGFFLETYHKKRFVALGICEPFLQDNHSSSVEG